MGVTASFQMEVFRMALDSIRSHKFRSLLTVLGIVVGVTTAITVASILTGLRQSLVTMIEDYGTNNIYVYHLSTGISLGERGADERTRAVLVPADAEAIRRQSPAVRDVALVVANPSTPGELDNNITRGGLNYRWARTQGVSPNYAQITNLALREGRFISEADDRERRLVMVVGVKAAAALFPGGGPVVGSEVRMGSRTFRIIGLLEKRKGGLLGENGEDNAVFIPFRTARKIAPGRDWLLLLVQAEAGQLEDALQQSEDLLRRRRGVPPDGENDFDIKTADKLIEQFDGITALAGLVTIAVSSLGLLVGGIGVMNIMFVSVTERTQEIGIRKALGARRADITGQFLYEAMALTFCGGLLGVTLALGVSRLVMLVVPALPAAVPLWAVASGLLVSAAVGLVFGVWPARRASRLDPIICLRYE